MLGLSSGAYPLSRNRYAFTDTVVHNFSHMLLFRNHFDFCHINGDCSEKQPTRDGDWFASHWYEILFLYELISTVTTSSLQYLTSLTLALYEDTGLYFANYSASPISPFGHGTECNLSLGMCIEGGKVTPYSKGALYSLPRDIVCSPGRRIVATWLPTNLPCLQWTGVCVRDCACTPPPEFQRERVLRVYSKAGKKQTTGRIIVAIPRGKEE